MAKAKKKKAKAAKPRKSAKKSRKAARKSVTVKDLSAKAAKSMKAGMAAVRRRLA